MDHKHDKASLMVAQQIVTSFENMVKRFPLENDFNDQKMDLYGSLFHLSQFTDCQELDQITGSVTKAINLLKSLSYDSPYRDLVEIINSLNEIKYELDEYLDDDE
jgi:hypothetical protein